MEGAFSAQTATEATGWDMEQQPSVWVEAGVEQAGPVMEGFMQML